MVVLAFVWIALMVLDMSGWSRPWVGWASNAVWAIFVVDFVLRLWVAPAKGAFLRRNVITLLSLLLPALRVLRGFTLLRAARGVRLFRVVASANRTWRALRKSMGRKGLSYVVALTLIVTFSGAAGMYNLEDRGFSSYGQALWWTAMIMTTMGSEYWPRTPEGRVLCLGLALYAFSIFGYVTAALASFLVERQAPAASDTIRQELRLLREEVARLRSAQEKKEMP